MTETKQCRSCKAIKPVAEFHKSPRNRDGYSSYCKPCHIAFNKAWRKAHPDKVRQYSKKWRDQHPEYGLQYEKANRSRNKARRAKWLKANPGKRRQYQYKFKYGITIAEYDEMFLAQKGKCAICQIPLDLLFVDHNHQTGRVRALLCDRCNRLLGIINEDAKILQSAIQYLRKHEGIITAMRPGELVFVKTTGEEVAVLGLTGNASLPDERIGPVSGTTVIVRRPMQGRDGLKHVLDYFLIEELETLEERVRRDHNNQDLVKKTLEAVHQGQDEQKMQPKPLLN